MFHSSPSPSSSSFVSCYGDHGLLLSPSVNGAGAASPQSFSDANGGGSSSSSFLSSSPPYSSFLPPLYLHGSGSSHSLPLPHQYTPDHHLNLNLSQFYSSSTPAQHHNLLAAPAAPVPDTPSRSSSSGDLLDFNSFAVRRAFSAGELQVSGDNYNQEGGAYAGRVGRYSAEERKERIERYRNKRSHRNFQKKITYSCRKTLADSRPRVRGRFARNSDNEAEVEIEGEAAAGSLGCYYSFGISDQGQSYTGAGVNYDGEFWRQMQATLVPEEEECSFYDEELLASFADVLSMNLLS